MDNKGKWEAQKTIFPLIFWEAFQLEQNTPLGYCQKIVRKKPLHTGI